MKIFLILLVLCTNQVLSQSKIYELQVKSVDSGAISLNDYKGKKLLIASISYEMMQKGGLAFLDSIQVAYPGIQVIAMPAEDFGDDRNGEVMQSIRKNETGYSLVAAASYVSRKNAAEQHPVMKFLTNVEENTHFDSDVNTDFQLYVISESGILYSVLEKGVSLKFVEKVLNQEDVKE